MVRSGPAINPYPFIFRLCLVISIIMLPALMFCQTDTAFLKKFSPPLLASFGKQPAARVSSYMIKARDKAPFKAYLGSLLRVSTVYEYIPSNIFIIRTDWQTLVDHVLPHTDVLFIDEQRTAKEELAVSGLDLSANKVNLLHHRFPFYNGQGRTVSVKENRPDTLDIDFKGRYIHTTSTSTVFSGHASIMATIIAGAGNTYYESKGVSPAARISSTNFNFLLPELPTYYQQYGITVQNHSYGTGIENFLWCRCFCL